MTISDGKESFKIDKKDITNKKEGYIIGIDENIWCIELFIKKDKNNCFTTIIKRLPSSSKDGGDELKSYNILDNPNFNEFLLSSSDYKEIKRLYENMQLVKKNRKQSIVEAFASLFAYECYENYYLQELWEVKDKDLFASITSGSDYQYECLCLKSEIYKKTKEILKEKYKVNLNKFIGGKIR